MEYRKATSTDLESLTQLCIITFTQTYGAQNTPENLQLYLENAFNPAQMTAELQSDTEAYFFIAEAQEPIAYIKLNYNCYPPDVNDGNWIEIQRIYVLEKYQGKGLGKVLLQIAETEARQANASHIWLGVWEQNPKAIAFYQKNGFTIIGKHDFWVGNDRQTDFVMQKQI
ncbi:MAG: GNAT family N-acetyltransferase [Saprospiraceae bacterium]